MKKLNRIVILLVAVMLITCILCACGEETGAQAQIPVTIHLNDDTSATLNTTFGELAHRTPTRTGYTFVGWTFDVDGEVAFDGVVDETTLNLVLYAQWTKNKYTVKFDVNGHQFIIENVEHGQSVTPPSQEEIAQHVSNNEIFVGWDTDEYENVVKNLIVYANVMPKQKTVIFMNGQTQVDEKSGLLAQQLQLPSAPVKTGFEFVGWANEDGTILSDGATFADADETVVAKFKLAKPLTPQVQGVTVLTYGQALQLTAIPASQTDGLTYSYSWTDEGQNVLSTSNELLLNLDAGSYSITLNYTVSCDGYESVSATPISRLVNVAKKQLTATLSHTITYGDALPTAFEINYVGFVGDDDASLAKGTQSIECNYNTKDNCNAYNISVSGLSFDNYVINGNNTIDGTLTVAPKDVAVALEFDGVFNGAALSRNYTAISASGLLDGHTIDVSFTTTGANVGTYSFITGEQNTLRLGAVQVKDGIRQIDANNYNISYNVVATITPASISYGKPAQDERLFHFDNAPHSANVIVATQGATITYGIDGETYGDTLPTFTLADTHRVYFKIECANYTTVTDHFDVTIEKANVTYSARPQNTVYGINFTFDQSAFDVSGDTFGIDLSPSIYCEYTVGDNAGSYPIALNSIDNENFNVTLVNSTLTVNQASLIVNVHSQQVTYGEAFDLTSASADLGGLVSGDDAQIEYAVDYTVGDNAGDTFDIIPTVGNNNYVLAQQSQNGTLTVVKRAIGITVDNKSVTYGNVFDDDYTFTVTSGSLFEEDGLNGTYQCAYQQGNDVGALEIDYTPANDNYQVAVTKGTLTIKPREISITVDDKSVTYGESFADDFTHTITSGELYSTDDLQIEYSTSYVAGDTTNATIEATSGNTNYDVTIQNGALTLAKREITLSYTGIKAQNGQAWSLTYTNANSANGIVGLYLTDKLNGTLQTVSSVNGEYADTTTTLSSFEWAVAYAITNGQADVTALYQITYDLSVTINDELIEHEPVSYNAQYDGLAHGGNVTVTDDATNVVITYSIDNVNFVSENPTFTNVSSNKVYYRITADERTQTSGYFTVNITKREATIIAQKQQTTFGEEFALNTTLYQTSNVIEGDVASLSITLSTQYAVGDNADEYPITVSYTNNDNYNVTATNGTLTVSPKSVNVTLSDVALTYGDAFDVDTYTYVSDDEVVSSQHFSVGCDYQQGSGAGSYPLVVESSNANYVAVYNKANVVVAKRTVTLKANDLSITYGDTANYTYTATNLYGNDTLTGVTFDCNGVNASDVGYTITPVVAQHANYEFEVQTGTLTIQKATLTAVFTQVNNITYGDTLPTFAISQYIGYKNGDTADTVEIKGSLVTECAYQTAPSAGTHQVTASGLSADNYQIVYSALSITVDKASLSITANAQNAITYGDARPTFTYTATGFKFDDDESLLDAVTVDCDYQQGSNANLQGYSFNVNLNGLALDNYNVVVGQAGRLVVNKASYTGITHQNFTGTYNPNHTLAGNYALSEGFAYREPNALPSVANNAVGYQAYYNADSTNYNDFNLTIYITLEKANVQIEAQNSVTNWTGAAITVAEFVGASCDNTDHATVTYSPQTVTDGGIYTITLTSAESANYNSATKTITFSVRAAKIGNDYYTVEDAFATGGAINLVGNAFLSVGNHTLASGSTLTLPSSADSSTTIGTATYGSGQKSYVDGNASYIEKVLTINEGTTLNVNGTILIQGLLGAAGGVLEGHTSGAHSQIVNNGAIILNSGAKLDVRGYIKGTGEVTMNNGSQTYSPFVVKDFRGGTNTVVSFNKGDISPFNVYELPNIQCEYVVYSGATYTGYVDLYASDKHNTDKKVMIGSGGILQLASGSYVVKSYDRASTKTTLQLVGNITFGSLSLTVKMSFISKTVNMSDVLFPIAWNYDVIIGDGTTETTVTSKYDYKFLTGSNLTILSNATVNASGQIIFYSTFTDATFGGCTYPTKDAAKLTINGGTLNLSNAFGGKIYGGENGGTITLGSAVSLSSKEGNSGSTSSSSALFGGGSFTTVFTANETAMLVNADGTSSNASASTTYTYTNGVWA